MEDQIVTIALAAVGLLGLALVTLRGGTPAALFAAIIASCTIASGSIWSLTPGLVHEGIAPAGITISTYTATVAIGLVWCVGRTSAAIPFLVPLLVLLGLALLGLFTVWPSSSEAWSGLLALGTGIAAWVVGITASRRIDINARSGQTVALVLAVSVAIQCVASAPEVASFIKLLDGSAVDRVSGTFGHPGNLAKSLGIGLILLLPLSRSSDRITRGAAITGLALSMALLGFTLSRANLIAGISVIILWVVLNPLGDRRHPRNWLLPLAALMILAPFLGAVLTRFELDPDGGSRPELVDTALFQIGQTPLTGIGPNSYVDVVGTYDYTTSTGLPVHNAFLLAAAELGIIGAILLFSPMVGAHIMAWRQRKRSAAARNSCMALLASAPGMLLVALTGWGLIAGPTLILWMFAIAFALGQCMEPLSEKKLTHEENDIKGSRRRVGSGGGDSFPPVGSQRRSNQSKQPA